MNLENSVLSERSQSQSTIKSMVPFIRNVQNRLIHRDRRLDWWLPRVGTVGRKWGVNANG